jgi:UDP-GlcNAc:undecaprenyl-phosphate GlcNAc-1-phosphate transferase
MIKQISYPLSVAVFPLVILSFTLFTAYLAQVEIVARENLPRRAAARRLALLLAALTYKRRLFEAILDFFLIAFAFYLAFALRYEFRLNEALTSLFLASFPIVLAAAYASFILLGVYRGLWRYTGLDDLVRIASAVCLSTATAVIALYFLYGFTGYSRVVFILYGLLLFLLMAGSRVSFRLFGLMIRKPRSAQVPILVYGADDRGEAVVRECRNNPARGFFPVGFLDEDPSKAGRTVLGLRIFAAHQLAQVAQRNRVQGCIISSVARLAEGQGQQILSLCRERGLWVKLLNIEFVEEGATGS